jgi:hypothetical protein
MITAPESQIEKMPAENATVKTTAEIPSPREQVIEPPSPEVAGAPDVSS